jgi:hypothetical protein
VSADPSARLVVWAIGVVNEEYARDAGRTLSTALTALVLHRAGQGAR